MGHVSECKNYRILSLKYWTSVDLCTKKKEFQFWCSNRVYGRGVSSEWDKFKNWTQNGTKTKNSIFQYKFHIKWFGQLGIWFLGISILLDKNVFKGKVIREIRHFIFFRQQNYTWCRWKIRNRSKALLAVDRTDSWLCFDECHC